MDLPKKAAKRIQKHYSPADSYHEPMALNSAQALTAQLLGYEDWHELLTTTKAGQHTPSPLDEDIEPMEQEKRIQFQTEVLAYVTPLIEPARRELALKFRVSAGNPKSTKFSEDAYRTNRLFFCKPEFDSAEPEWRFLPSMRSKETREQLFALVDEWTAGRMNYGDYSGELEKIIDDQPENLTAYFYILSACFLDLRAWEVAASYLPALEEQILRAIPAHYPKTKKVPSLVWGTIENRDYLRCLYHLAVGYYADQQFDKAKEWFKFLTRCTEFPMGNEQGYLDDLKQSEPEGDLHINDMQQ